MKEYTRIKHSVLMNIFAKGLLNKREMQIAWTVIRQSWGWGGGKSNWTNKKLSNTYLAKETALKKNHVSETLKRMILERKILVNENGLYSFNEHPSKWSMVPKRDYLKPKSSPKKVTKQSQKGNKIVPKKELFSPKKGLFDTSNIDVSNMSIRDLRAHIKAPKEIFKETIKETIKESILSLRFFYEEKITKLRTLSDTRRGMVKNRLENFSLNELKQVVTNISNSDWNMGRDPKTNGKKFCDFELLFRSDAKVEQYLNMESAKKITWKEKYRDKGTVRGDR